MITEPHPEAELRHGATIGRFVVVGQLGAGGMGIVYEAHDRELDRRVALKVMRGSSASQEERLRMLREGQAMARVTHPNVITVYEVGIEGTIVFLAQELLDGGTLGEWLEVPRARHEVIANFAAAGRGLAAAHAAGLVHRDFKPDNVLLGRDGRVRVADFGLARALGADEVILLTRRAGAAPGETPSPMNPLTRTGAVMGTPMFMAPEQHNGEPADERSDQFSFCVALYHALYGDWPFAGKTSVALADAVMRGRMQPPPRRIPSRLRRILVRGLRVDPAERYPSMAALLNELTHDPGPRRWRLAVAAGLAIVLAGAVVGGYALSSRTRPPPAQPPAPPPVALDVKNLSAPVATEWLSSSMERGQLDDAFEKYDMAGALKLAANDPAQASVAWSAAAFALALRGRLDEADAKLRDAVAKTSQDPIALAYADMATAAIAAARGDLKTALDRGRSCATSFARSVPALAAMCMQLHGKAAADMGDLGLARTTYTEGLAIAKQANSAPHATSLELALALLDLDEGHDEKAASAATALQVATAERFAESPEAQAWILLARARLAQAKSNEAFELLEHVKPSRLQDFAIRIEHAITVGATHGVLGDPRGLEQIEAARAEAESHGFAGLVLEARLARLSVLLTHSDPAAESEQRTLVADAHRKAHGRIAWLAETINDR